MISSFITDTSAKNSRNQVCQYYSKWKVGRFGDTM